MDEGIAYIRDTVMPAVRQTDGWVGLSMLAERDTGRCIVTTSWADADAMHRSAESVVAMRQRAAELMGGPAEVQEWEIAVLHRTQPSPEAACCRVIWTRGDPANLERSVDAFRMSLLPRLEELPGFCSISMLVDPENGRSVTATVYENRDAMNRAAETAKPMREEFTRQVGSEILEVAEFDLVLAHLRVPETV